MHSYLNIIKYYVTSGDTRTLEKYASRQENWISQVELRAHQEYGRCIVEKHGWYDEKQ